MSNELINSQYQKLKDEQLERIKFRDNLILVQLGTVGTIITFILSKDNVDRPYMEFGYLLIPWISSVLAFLYYSQDEKIKDIKNFLVSEEQKGVYGDCSWERHKSSGKRIGMLIAVDIIIFLLPSLLALGRSLYVIRTSHIGMLPLLYMVWGICVCVFGFTVYVMKHSYWPSSKDSVKKEPVEKDTFGKNLSKRV
ncbi:MAG: hypothetical protein QM758_07955 [Armatimonas sp.]